MKRSKLIAIIIGSVLGLGLIVGGFLLLQTFTRASSEQPLSVNQSEITDTSAKITWQTGNDTVGTVVTYGTSPDLANPQIAPAETPMGKEHSAVLTMLTPGTDYYFVLGTQKEFNNEGAPWMFTTKSSNETVTNLIISPTVTATNSGGLSPVDPTPTVAVDADEEVNTCTETNCAAIKAKLGKECSTQEYMRCIKSQSNPSPSN